MLQLKLHSIKYFFTNDYIKHYKKKKLSSVTLQYDLFRIKPNITLAK